MARSGTGRDDRENVETLATDTITTIESIIDKNKEKENDDDDRDKITEN
ncbi:MAG: hypothetical protein ACQPRI_06185 [Solitalea-like symbiont of Tyrophagus putrescentiae]